MILLTAIADLGRWVSHLALLLELCSTALVDLGLGLLLLLQRLGGDDVAVGGHARSGHFCRLFYG